MEDKSIKKAIAKSEYKRDKDFLQSLEKRQKKTKPNYLVAASVVALLGLSIAFVFFNKSESNDTLFAEYFVPYENVIHPISRGEKPTNMQERAFFYYESQQYKDALMVFDSLIKKEPGNKVIFNFYKANTLLKENKDVDVVIEILKNNIDTSDKWKDKNLWYLSMAYLKKDNRELALKTLKQLNTLDSNFKMSQRLKLLEALD